jgi:hypothetical protein
VAKTRENLFFCIKNVCYFRLLDLSDEGNVDINNLLSYKPNSDTFLMTLDSSTSSRVKSFPICQTKISDESSVVKKVSFVTFSIPL